MAYSGGPHPGVQIVDGTKQTGPAAGFVPMNIPGDTPPSYTMATGQPGPGFPLGPQPGGLYAPQFGGANMGQ